MLTTDAADAAGAADTAGAAARRLDRACACDCDSTDWALLTRALLTRALLGGALLTGALLAEEALLTALLTGWDRGKGKGSSMA